MTTDEIMSTMPADDDRCQRFADYVVDNYMDIGCDFPLSLWAQSPALGFSCILNTQDDLSGQQDYGPLAKRIKYKK